MGLFDFLTGNKDGKDAVTTAATPPSSANPGDPSPAAAGRETGAGERSGGPTVPGTPGETAGADDDRPAGGAWDYGALFEPPPAPPKLEAAIASVGPTDPAKLLELKPPIVDAISTVFDPEIPVNIYELGLIYDVIIDAEARVLVRMTLTSPACPSAQQLPSEVQYKVKAVPGVADAVVDIVWEPPWTKDMMSDAAKLSLGIW
jgi:FeS assembly SUF system protein